MEFKFIINALLRRKWVIIACTSAAIITALIFVLTKEKLYLSAAQYSTGFTMKQAVKISNDEGLNIFEIDQRFKNVIETFNSPMVIGMLSYDLMLHDLEEKRPFRTLTEKELQSKAYTGINAKQAAKVLRQKKANLELLRAYDPDEAKVYDLLRLYRYDNDAIKDKLSVGQIAGTDFLNILYSSENPELSAYVVNTIGREFFRFFSSINEERSGQSVTKLDSLKDAKKKELEEKTKRLQDFKGSFGTPNVEDAAKGAMEMVRQYTVQLNQEESKLNSAKQQLNGITQQLTALNQGGTATNYNADIMRLRNENIELQKTVDTDPTAKTKIEDNQNKIVQLQRSAGGGTSRADINKKRDDLTSKKFDLEAEMAGATETIKGLNSKIRLYQGLQTSGAGSDVVERALTNEMEQATKDYQLYSSKLASANDVNVSPDINFKQTLLGQPAIKPQPGNSKLILAIAAIAAFGFSAFVIVILDFLDTSLRAPSVFHKAVKLKLLAPINKINLKNRDVSSYFNAASEQRITEDNMFIENIRKLRFEIESSGKKIFLFTSTKQGEGKSTILEALSNSFSISKKKLLLIDSNFSNNTLTERFKAKPALEQFSVNGEKSITDKFRTIVSSTEIASVDVVGCKEGNYSPSEILPKNNMLENLRVIAAEYDYVFIEGAALNVHADTKELLKYADGIVTVFSSKSVIKQIDKESIHFLRNSDKLVGAVLNAVEEENIDL